MIKSLALKTAELIIATALVGMFYASIDMLMIYTIRPRD
jgi:hypothetical protein